MKPSEMKIDRKYHKIQSMYHRDQKTGTFLMDHYSRPEFHSLRDIQWVFTEKIDGMNIRVIYNADDKSIRFAGRTDKADLPEELLGYLEAKFTLEAIDKAGMSECSFIIFGEGCGPKIQKGGGRYGDKQRFILFDVLIEGIWLEFNDKTSIAHKFDVAYSPLMYFCTIAGAEGFVRHGLRSSYGNFFAEGLVGCPAGGLLDRKGKRIIVKIKHVDYYVPRKL